MLANLRAHLLLALCRAVRAHGVQTVAAALQRHGIAEGPALALCGEAMQVPPSRAMARGPHLDALERECLDILRERGCWLTTRRVWARIYDGSPANVRAALVRLERLGLAESAQGRRARAWKATDPNAPTPADEMLVEWITEVPHVSV